MKLKKWAFIYLSPGFNQKQNSYQTKSDMCEFQIIGLDVTEKELVIEIAKTLLKQNIQTIELCGGFGPEWVTKVSEAINYKIPVGSVMYGPEFRQPLFELMNFNN